MKKLLGPLVAALMTASAVAGTTAPTQAGAGAPAVASESRSTVLERADVPWERVGTGWTLAAVVHGPRAPDGYVRARQRTLDLLSPDGERYEVYRSVLERRPRGWLKGDFYLTDVDLARRTVLLVAPSGPHRLHATAVDLATGARRSLLLPRNAGEVGVGLRPDGTGVLAQTFTGNVVSLPWAGGRSVLARGVVGGVIATADGTALVSNDRRALDVVPLDGSTRTTVPTPGDCRPLRWYDDGALLASCYSRRGTRLTAVGLDGTVTPLAGLRRVNSPGFHGPSWDDTDIRVVGDRAYFGANGPCGGSFLTTERGDGSPVMVRVPDSTGGVTLLGTSGEWLRIAHTSTCDAATPRSVLSLFDPATRAELRLLTLGRREAWAQLRPWGEQRPWGS